MTAALTSLRSFQLQVDGRHNLLPDMNLFALKSLPNCVAGRAPMHGYVNPVIRSKYRTWVLTFVPLPPKGERSDSIYCAI